MSIMLENSVIEKLMLSKNVNNKKCATKLILFNEKKIGKDSDDYLMQICKIESSESFSKQPTQLIVELNSSLRHIIVTHQ